MGTKVGAAAYFGGLCVGFSALVPLTTKLALMKLGFAHAWPCIASTSS